MIKPDEAELMPTIAASDIDRPAGPAGTLDISQAPVGVVAGEQPQFADETARLLRHRLTAVSLLFSVILAAAFVGNLRLGETVLWLLRAINVGVLVGCYGLLRSSRQFSLRQLRFFEVVVFGIVAVQLMSMLARQMLGYAAAADSTAFFAYRERIISATAVIMLVYAIFMPNTWQRAASILIPAATLPYLTTWIMGRFSPAIAGILERHQFAFPLPITLVAAAIGIYGSHIIHAIRREAFKARQLGQYRLGQKLGSGGMGVVYRAEHMLLKRPCAIKLIQSDTATDETAIARFEKEVKITAQLTHWNTVQIFDFGRTEDGTFYYVMELLPGMSLDELVTRHGPVAPARAVYLLRQVCGALHEAHGRGLIHRDLKPGNIFVSERGGEHDVAKLLDFGLVKVNDLVNHSRSDSPARSPRSDSFSGTPHFMSPEQFSAYDEVDGRSDIYSLGAVAHFMLTGVPPFTGNSILELKLAHEEQPVQPLSRLAVVPSDLESCVLRCLEKDPADRYATVLQLRQALESCQCANDWHAERARQWWERLAAETTPRAART